MQTSNYITVAAFLLQGIGLLIAGYKLSGKGIAAGGRPTIGRFLFFSGKISLFSSWALCLLKAIVPSMG